MVFTNNARLCKKIIAVTAKISASSQDRSKSFIFSIKKVAIAIAAQGIVQNDDFKRPANDQSIFECWHCIVCSIKCL